jgi:hypothetical protein
LVPPDFIRRNDMRFLLATAAAAALLAVGGPTKSFAADATATQTQTAAIDQQIEATIKNMQARLDQDETVMRQMEGKLGLTTGNAPFCRSHGYDVSKGECN